MIRLRIGIIEENKIVGKTKTDGIKSQHIRDCCRIQTINERVGRRIRKLNEHVTRIDFERLIKISKDNLPAGRSSGLSKRRRSDLIPN